MLIKEPRLRARAGNMPTMPGISRLLLAVLLISSTGASFAQMPDPISSVPADSDAQATAAGTERVFGGTEVPDG